MTIFLEKLLYSIERDSPSEMSYRSVCAVRRLVCVGLMGLPVIWGRNELHAASSDQV